MAVFSLCLGSTYLQSMSSLELRSARFAPLMCAPWPARGLCSTVRSRRGQRRQLRVVWVSSLSLRLSHWSSLSKTYL